MVYIAAGEVGLQVAWMGEVGAGNLWVVVSMVAGNARLWVVKAGSHRVFVQMATGMVRLRVMGAVNELCQRKQNRKLNSTDEVYEMSALDCISSYSRCG